MAKKNFGKIFEEDFKKSVPEEHVYIRLRDAPQSFNQGIGGIRFSWKNPCDTLIFNCLNRMLYAIELKTTKEKYMTFEHPYLDDKQPSKMIHKHQINGLFDYSKHKYVESGFILNFRDEKEGTQKTYYINIKNFIGMILKINKKSFKEEDLLKNGAFTITGEKKRTRYYWDLVSFFNTTKMN